MAKDEKIKPIEPKQLRFCQEYVIDFNGSQAAIRAGYSKKTANEQASRMLAKVNIQEKIKELTQKVAEKLEITQEKVLAEYAKMAFFDVRTIFNENNALKSVNELNDDAGASIASIKVLEEFAGRGEERVHIGNTIEVKLNNKISALDSIRDMLGYKAPTKIANTNKNGDDIEPIDYSQYTDAELRTLAKLQSKGRASKT